MPRTARLNTPGVLHHVMIRGIEDRKISTLKNWYGIFIFTLLNFPEGTLFNRVNPIRAGIISSLDESKIQTHNKSLHTDKLSAPLQACR
jgi:hypothetical protein